MTNITLTSQEPTVTTPVDGATTVPLLSGAERMASPYPLGLPSGSIRAILALLIVGVVSAQALRNEPIGELWMQALMIALAHYYTSRRFIELPRDVFTRLEHEGVIERESNPLFLPRYSIRVLIVLLFAGVGVLLYRQGRIFEPSSISLLGSVFAYFLGILWKIIQGWLTRRGMGSVWKRWKDIKALAVLVALVIAAVIHLCGWGQSLPKFVDQTALGLVLFYFGSR